MSVKVYPTYLYVQYYVSHSGYTDNMAHLSFKKCNCSHAFFIRAHKLLIKMIDEGYDLKKKIYNTVHTFFCQPQNHNGDTMHLRTRTDESRVMSDRGITSSSRCYGYGLNLTLPPVRNPSEMH